MKVSEYVKIGSIPALLFAFLLAPAAAPASPLGDINKDCRVNLQDVKVLAQQWLEPDCTGVLCADMDGVDGINWADFAVFCENWGRDCNDIHLVINELQADNETTIADGQGDYDDWFEIYNDSQITADVGGLYVTDDFNIPDLNQIPANCPAQTAIEPHGYLLIWADKDPEDGPLHLGLSLKADGERLGLVAFDGSTFIDSIVFGDQGNDKSYGRFPDGDLTLLDFD